MVNVLTSDSDTSYHLSDYAVWHRKAIEDVTQTRIEVVDDLPRPVLADRAGKLAWIRSDLNPRYFHWLLSELGRFMKFGPEAVPEFTLNHQPKLWVVGGTGGASAKRFGRG